MKYFSDQENGDRIRNVEEIPLNVWGGIVSAIEMLVSSGAFGSNYPDVCPDGGAIFGTEVKSFELALKSEIPDIDWPLITEKNDSDSWEKTPYVPHYLVILDLIQFCYENVAKPIQDSYHSYFSHNHLSFDVEQGREEFRTKINRIFSRNGIAFELKGNGVIVRVLPPILGESLNSTFFNTGDSTLNELLSNARTKFINPDTNIRREALEKLWDAWERLKSLNDPNNKKNSITNTLNTCSTEQNFRNLLETEASTLTKIGNSFHIRHTEVKQTQIKDSEHIDYLFHRLMSMIWLIINKEA